LIIPAIIKILVIFGLIMILNRLRLNLGLALFMGAFVLGLWMDLGLVDLAKGGLNSLSSAQTISLILVVYLIMLMSSIMEKSGHMGRLVKSFSLLSKDGRTVGSVMTALIGLLPMPGGALFSAPMVEASLPNGSVSREQKTAVNYWFRHIWEYWWPLYPGVILAVALLEVETWHFMVAMAPMTLVSILAGIFFILRPIGNAERNSESSISWSRIKQFIWEMVPILIVIAVIVVVTGLIGILRLMGYNVETPSLLPILPGLVISIIWVCAINHTPFSQFRSVLMSKGILTMLLMIVAIMFFNGIMEASDIVVHIRNELMTYGIPAILLILIMPFLSGFVLGLSIGFVGASFPLIIPLFQSPDIVEYLSFAALAYVFGYMGMMLSPVHLCLLVTKDYFKASLFDSYRYILKTALTVMATAVILFSIVRMI